TETTLLDTDIMHDATDCRTAFEQGRLRLKATSAQHDSRIIWGDDESERANNGQCDDMRFEGFGMSEDELLTSDVKHDASDCRGAYINGEISLLS
ncbi:MAG: hypothetical protein WAT93_12430, partial [Pontixanthobacter sp.]